MAALDPGIYVMRGAGEAVCSKGGGARVAEVHRVLPTGLNESEPSFYSTAAQVIPVFFLASPWSFRP